MPKPPGPRNRGHASGNFLLDGRQSRAGGPVSVPRFGRGLGAGGSRRAAMPCILHPDRPPLSGEVYRQPRLRRSTRSPRRPTARHNAATAQRAMSGPGRFAVLGSRRLRWATATAGATWRRSSPPPGTRPRPPTAARPHVGQRPLAEVFPPQLQIERANLLLERPRWSAAGRAPP